MHSSLSYIDTHCHLDMQVYQDDFTEVLSRAAAADIIHIISIGIDLDSSVQAVKLAEQYPQISATVGIHPHDVQHIGDATYTQLISVLNENRQHIVGYGEIGLDYFKNYSPVDLQKHHFRKQLEIAKEFKLPVVIHDRDAHDDIITILEETGPFEAGGVVHCFSGDYVFARKVLSQNFNISIPGIVTFKNAHDLHEVVKKIPLESMLLETDGPFLAPVPFRGKRNESSYIPIIAEKIAELRQTTKEKIAETTTANAKALFNLDIVQ